MKIINKQQAIVQGLSRYFTGKPCKHGHVGERYINSDCIICSYERQKKYSGRKREKSKEWRKINREKSRKSSKEWRKNNPDRAHELCKRWKEINKERYTELRNESKRKTVENLAEGYLIYLLVAQFNISRDQITPELIEAKRNQLKEYRLLKEIKNHGTDIKAG